MSSYSVHLYQIRQSRTRTAANECQDTVLNEGPGLETARQTWCGRNPMGRMGSVGELDGVIVLLASDNASSYITGADFVVDGGQILF